MGGVISYLGYMMILGILVLWMCIRIWKDSPGLAVACFFAWPIAIYALIRNWGQPGTDIRIPFFFAVVTAGLMQWAASRAIDQFDRGGDLAYMFTAEEIAEIREEDPEFAAQIEAAQAREFGAQVEAEYVDVPAEAYGDPRAAGDSRGSATISDLGPVAPGVDVSIRTLALREAERQLQPSRGRIELAVAGAELALPAQYHFVPAAQLGRLASMGAGKVDEHTLGWIVHDKVSIAEDDGWFVAVRYAPVGPLAPPPDSAGWRQSLPAYLVGELNEAESLLAPAWSAEHQVATLIDHETRDGATLARARALKPLAGGVLEFWVAGLSDERRELGLRAARLMAARSRGPMAQVAPPAADPAAAPQLSPLSTYVTTGSAKARRS